MKIVRNDKIWMEDEAILQLKEFSQFEGVIDAVGLPDLHQGKVPVGATFMTKDLIYPFFIGNDIGCGMALFDTNIKKKKFDLDSFTKKLKDQRMTGKFSIGGGNHFAEIEVIDKIYTDELNLNKNHLYVLVHSGSRGMGEDIYKDYASVNGLKVNSVEFNEYLKLHQEAIDFSIQNREMIAEQLMDYIGIKHQNEKIVECLHNQIEKHDDYFYHHKGSISTFNPYAIIAGTRGDYSYVVKCIPTKETLYSISHGAGRKWPRNLCKGRLENKYKKDELMKTKMGGRIITDKKELLYEEASEAYKNIEDVIEILLDYQCIELVARLKPLITFKA